MSKSKVSILFYIPEIDQTWGGVRQYSVNLLKSIADLSHEKFNVFVFHKNSDAEILRIIKEFPNLKLLASEDVRLSSSNRIKNYFIKKFSLLFEFIYGRKQYRFKENTALDIIIERNQINVLHCPFQFLPITDKKVYKITTIHDVQELHFPKFFSPETRANRAANIPKYIKASNKIFVSYEHVKKDLINYFDVTPDKINICLLKMDNLWFERFEKNELQKKSFNFPFKKYLLYPANFWPHKNHEILIEALNIINIECSEKVNLVFTGDEKLEIVKDLKKKIKYYDLEENIFFAGIVEEGSLYAIYKNAVGVVIPTLYEAGSFPLMESILMEIPVICSNVTSLPKTIGDSKFTFDPNNINEVKVKMMELFYNPCYRISSILNSQMQKNDLINTRADEIIKDVYLNI